MATNEQYRHSIEFLELRQLHFDSGNPRIPANVDAQSEEQLLRWMLNRESVTELMGSIAARGFFPGEPLLVAPRNEGLTAGGELPTLEQEFIVVEGNRRLAAAKLLADPGSAPVKQGAVASIVADAKFVPTELPSIVFSHREDLLDYLGYRHITGIKEWDPLEKARYLAQLRDRAEKRGDTANLTTLAQIIGSKGAYVGRLLTALHAFDLLSAEEFFGQIGINEQDVPFSLLSTCLNYPNLVEFLGLHDATRPEGLDDDSLRWLARWLFEKPDGGDPVVRESRDIRVLARVVNDEKSLQVLKTGATLQAADLATGSPAKAFSSELTASRTHLRSATRQIDNVPSPTATDVDIAAEIEQAARELHATLDSRRPTRR